VLLEVIVSIGLLVFGLAVIGVRISSALQTARSVDFDTRAMMLTDTLLAELDAGMITMDLNDDEIKGNFMNQAPGYTWRIGIEKADIDDFFMLKVEIAYNKDQEEAQIDDPLLDTSIEDEGAKIIQTVYRLYPKPAQIDLERDYGLSQDDMKELFGEGTSETGEGGEGGEGTGKSGQGTSDLMQMATDLGIDLTQFSFLFDGSSFDPRELSKLPEDQFTQLATLLSTVFSQGGQAIQEFEKAGGKEKLDEMSRQKQNERNQGGDR